MNKRVPQEIEHTSVLGVIPTVTLNDVKASGDAQCLVLGAGIVGVSTALALQAHGLQVLLLDRQSPGKETSFGNAGLIQREAVVPYAFPRNWAKVMEVAFGNGNDVHYHLGAMPAFAGPLLRYRWYSEPARHAAISRSYASLIEQSITEHVRWIEASGASELVKKEGWVQAFRSSKAFEAAALDSKARAAEYGLNVDVLGRDGMNARLGALRTDLLQGAVHWLDAWTVSDPGVLVERYAKLFLANGGHLAFGDANSLRRTSQGWAVKTDHGIAEAPSAVVALGPWATGVLSPLGYKLPIFVKRGYHRHYDGGTSLKIPTLDAEHGVMMAPMSRGLRLLTGAEFAAAGAPPTPVQLVAAERAANELIDVGNPVDPQPWLGSRPCTVDMKPIIGAAPKHDGLWFNLGHGHQGFTLGPASGRLLAEQILGLPPYIDPAPFSPARFA
ncbi:amino acid dehydrogenase [Xenophilus aerolatus]|nr:amino acid dehydrogenase [Xenophilus aerolatus]